MRGVSPPETLSTSSGQTSTQVPQLLQSVALISTTGIALSFLFRGPGFRVLTVTLDPNLPGERHPVLFIAMLWYRNSLNTRSLIPLLDRNPFEPVRIVTIGIVLPKMARPALGAV